MTKAIILDMDGTLANLYGVKNWLPKLRAYDPSPYREAAPMWDMERLAKLLVKAHLRGITVAVVTWLSKVSTPQYDQSVTLAKRDWLHKWGVPYDLFIPLDYGVAKHEVVKAMVADEAILFDDNAEIREGWNLGQTINPETTDILKVLEKLVENE